MPGRHRRAQGRRGEAARVAQLGFLLGAFARTIEGEITKNLDALLAPLGMVLGHRPLAVLEGDMLAILSAGAYGMTMASNYNTRPRAAEVMIDGDRVHVIRDREQVSKLFAGEHRV